LDAKIPCFGLFLPDSGLIRHNWEAAKWSGGAGGAGERRKAGSLPGYLFAPCTGALTASGRRRRRAVHKCLMLTKYAIVSNFCQGRRGRIISAK